MTKTTDLQTTQPNPVQISPAPGVTSRTGVGGTELVRHAETASAAVAAAAQAQIQAAYTMALHRPRDLDHVRVNLLKDCARPSFAEVARYRKPIGRGVEGPSIRFVEAALRRLGNVDSSSVVTLDDDHKRIVQVTVIDLEANYRQSESVTIRKEIERTSRIAGRDVLAQRPNSRGGTVYTYTAIGEDEIADKVAAAVSKAMRRCGLRVIPGDITEECMVAVRRTKQDAAAKDPDAERHALADAFSGLGVLPKDLTAYLGHDLAKCSPVEITELRDVYTAIRDGEVTWVEILSHKQGERDAPSSGTDKLKAELEKK